MKIVVFGEQFHSPAFYRRWELFAQSFPDVDLTLLTPDRIDWRNKKNFEFGASLTEGKTVENRNFRIRLIQRKNHALGWTSPDFKKILPEINPDIIYVSGGHYAMHLFQILHIRNKMLPNMKVVSFSMRGPAYNVETWKMKVQPVSSYIKRRFIMYYYVKFGLKYFNKYCDAVLCHYPRAVECFRNEGYKGPIYMQTQVGVNPELFHENNVWREEIRKKYNLTDEYVFGSGTRFIIEKGVDDIIASLPNEGNWKYMIIGAGKPDEEARIRKEIERSGKSEKIIMTGEIGFEEMPKYWNALDCVVHVPRSSVKWEETFSIALVQAMITGKPITASDSGSVPYQVGPEGMIVKAGDFNAIREKMEWALSHQEEAKIIGEKMRRRAYNCFSIRHLNALLYKTFKEDILTGQYDEAKADMSAYKTEETYEKQTADNK